MKVVNAFALIVISLLGLAYSQDVEMEANILKLHVVGDANYEENVRGLYTECTGNCGKGKNSKRANRKFKSGGKAGRCKSGGKSGGKSGCKSGGKSGCKSGCKSGGKSGGKSGSKSGGKSGNGAMKGSEDMRKTMNLYIRRRGF